MDSYEVLKNLQLAADETSIVVVCGTSQYGIDSFNDQLEIVAGKENHRNVGFLRQSILEADISDGKNIRIRIDSDSFDIDLIAFGSRADIYDHDETGNPKLKIFPENSCIEKHGLQSFIF